MIYIYSKIDKDYNKEDKIEELIKTEKENYCNMIDFIQCLNGGCLTIQLTQGLSVKNIFDTYQNKNANKNKLLYYIKFNDDYDEEKDINYYKNKISENPDLKYEEIISFGDNLIIIFNDSLQFSLFSKKQNLNLKFIPYKQSMQDITSSNNENNKIDENNMKIFKVNFEKNCSVSEIHKKMQKYMKMIQSKYNYKLNYYIDQKSDSYSLSVYYYIKSEDPVSINKNDIIGKECEENLNNKIFSINWFTFTSDYEYISKFLDYCHQYNINVVLRNKKYFDDLKRYHYSLFLFLIKQKNLGLLWYNLYNFELISCFLMNNLLIHILSQPHIFLCPHFLFFLHFPYLF